MIQNYRIRRQKNQVAQNLAFEKFWRYTISISCWQLVLVLKTQKCVLTPFCQTL